MNYGTDTHTSTTAAIKADGLEIAGAAKRHLRSDLVFLSLSLVAVAVSVCLLVFVNEDQDGWLIVASLIGGFATFVAVSRLLRIVRHHL